METHTVALVAANTRKPGVVIVVVDALVALPWLHMFRYDTLRFLCRNGDHK